MIKSKYLIESFYLNFKIQDTIVTVYKNPTPKELKEINTEIITSGYSKFFINQYRGIIDKNGDLIVWMFDKLHGDILKIIDKEEGSNYLEQYRNATLENMIPIYMEDTFVSLNFQLSDKKLMQELINKCKDKNPSFTFIDENKDINNG